MAVTLTTAAATTKTSRSFYTRISYFPPCKSRLANRRHFCPPPLCRSTALRVFSSQSQVPSMGSDHKSLKKGIAELYDESSGVWENVWGDHMHHGFYDPQISASNHRLAQVRMIEECLRFCGVSDVIDV